MEETSQASSKTYNSKILVDEGMCGKNMRSVLRDLKLQQNNSIQINFLKQISDCSFV